MTKKEAIKIYLTPKQAISVLPNKEFIHVFRNNPQFGLLGTDWERDDLINELNESEIIELAGENARKAGHGLGAYKKTAKYQREILFIETDEEKLLELEKELEILKEAPKDGKDG